MRLRPHGWVVPVALLLLLSPEAVAQSGPESTSDLLLTNARLVTPATQTVERGTLHIEGEQVAAVLDEAPASFDGRILDVQGRWVLPGLIDTHVHSWGNAGPAFRERQLLQTAGTARALLFSGVTAFLDLFSPETYIFDLRNRQRTQGLRGADIYAAGPILTCPDGHGTEYGTPTRTVTSPSDARRTVDSLATREPDVVKLVYHPHRTERFPSMDRPTMAAVVEAAAAHGLPSVVHIESWRGAHEAIEAGVDAITHTPPAPLPDSTLAAMQAHGTAWIPTLAVHTELSHLLNHPSRLKNDLLRAVADSSLLAAYHDTSGVPQPIRSWVDRQSRHRGVRLQAVRKAAEANVPILAGTDAGNPGVFQGYSLHRELQLLVEAGLSNGKALAAATTAPARFLDASVGLQPGARANLLVLNASPLSDIRHTQAIHRVIHRGRVVDRSALQDKIDTATPDVPLP